MSALTEMEWVNATVRASATIPPRLVDEAILEALIVEGYWEVAVAFAEEAHIYLPLTVDPRLPRPVRSSDSPAPLPSVQTLIGQPLSVSLAPSSSLPTQTAPSSSSAQTDPSSLANLPVDHASSARHRTEIRRLIHAGMIDEAIAAISAAFPKVLQRRGEGERPSRSKGGTEPMEDDEEDEEEDEEEGEEGDEEESHQRSRSRGRTGAPSARGRVAGTAGTAIGGTGGAGGTGVTGARTTGTAAVRRPSKGRRRATPKRRKSKGEAGGKPEASWGEKEIGTVVGGVDVLLELQLLKLIHLIQTNRVEEALALTYCAMGGSEEPGSGSGSGQASGLVGSVSGGASSAKQTGGLTQALATAAGVHRVEEVLALLVGGQSSELMSHSHRTHVASLVNDAILQSLGLPHECSLVGALRLCAWEEKQLKDSGVKVPSTISGLPPSPSLLPRSTSTTSSTSSSATSQSIAAASSTSLPSFFSLRPGRTTSSF